MNYIVPLIPSLVFLLCKPDWVDGPKQLTFRWLSQYWLDGPIIFWLPLNSSRSVSQQWCLENQIVTSWNSLSSWSLRICKISILNSFLMIGLVIPKSKCLLFSDKTNRNQPIDQLELGNSFTSSSSWIIAARTTLSHRRNTATRSASSSATSPRFCFLE